jgi:tRNA A-37 threonylcarbamoyl transferase component Bud32
VSSDAPTLTSAFRTAIAGRYVVEHEAGAGGMAIVYLANDVRHDRRVALKVLRPELAAVIGAERFLAEIRTTAKLQHPGILPLFDSGEAASQLFYVMPFVDGETLRHRLDRERQLPVADAVRIASEVGDALAYAHEHGVVHRDIKPENVLLQSGRPVVADFGIALAVQEAGGNRLTQTGLSLGTPQYMSPEQAAGERGVDGRADQYALAAMLYEMLAGEPPFSAPTTQALIARVMTEEARPLSIVRKSVPGSVDAAVRQALEKIPADRFATTREFVAALNGDAVAPSARRFVASRAPTNNRKWMAICAGALVAGALIATAVNRAMRPSATKTSAAPVVFSLEPDSGRSIGLACCGNIFALSPDGRRIVFQATDGDSIRRLHVREMDALSSRSFPGTENAHELFFSPDGQQVGFTSGRAIKILDIRSSRIHNLTDLPPTGFLGGGTWMNDGRIAYAVGNSLLAVPAEGGASTELARVDSAKKEFQLGGPNVVAGTDLVLFSVERERGEPIIRALWTKTGKTKDVALGVAAVVDTTHGYLFAVRSDGSIEARHFDPATADTSGGAIRVGEPVSLRSPVFLFAEFAASATGTIATVRRSPYSFNGEGTLHIVDADGKDQTHTLPFRARRVIRPRFSPDGTLIAALADIVETRLINAFVYDPERRSSTPLAAGGSPVSVEWISSDSVLTVATSGEVFVQNIHGGTPRRLGALGGWNSPGQASVNGKWMVFDGDRGGPPDIGLANLDSVNHSRVLIGSPLAESRPRLSPDGARIAFLVTREGRASLHVAMFPSLADETVVGDAGATDPKWGRDGTLYYIGADRTPHGVTFKGGAKVDVPSKLVVPASINPGAEGWDVDAAGKRYVFGADAASNGGPTRLVLTLNPLGKR